MFGDAVYVILLIMNFNMHCVFDADIKRKIAMIHQ